MHEGRLFHLHPPCCDPHSGTVCLALCGHRLLLHAFCFYLFYAPCLIVFLCGMPALTLSTRNPSVLEIIGKCHRSFFSLQRRITLPPSRVKKKQDPSHRFTKTTASTGPPTPKCCFRASPSTAINPMQQWH